MLLIYTHDITERLTYIFNYMFRDVMGCEIFITTDKDKFLNHEGPKLSYTLAPILDEIFFTSTSILFEKDIKEQDPIVFSFKNQPAFFKTENGIWPFDPFAASFYLVSRYEEYLPFEADMHGRFTEKNSIAFNNSFLDKPVVNIWAKQIKNILSDKFPELKFDQRKSKFINTIDVDVAFAYKGRSLKRTVGGLMRSVLKFNFKEIGERFRVLTGKQKDPYDTFDLFEEIREKLRFDQVYFFLLSYGSAFDKNVSPKSKEMKDLINKISQRSSIGIHPSYYSQEKNLLGEEINRLKSQQSRSVKNSRQHFIRLNFPETYRSLLTKGIEQDYSMGYPSSLGFRAGTCTPFNFFDLTNNKMTSLMVFPFQLMDGALKDYQKITPEKAIQEAKKLIDLIKEVNGTFIQVWHNQSLSESDGWQGWAEVYTEITKYAAKIV